MRKGLTGVQWIIGAVIGLAIVVLMLFQIGDSARQLRAVEEMAQCNGTIGALVEGDARCFVDADCTIPTLENAGDYDIIKTGSKLGCDGGYCCILQSKEGAEECVEQTEGTILLLASQGELNSCVQPSRIMQSIDPEKEMVVGMIVNQDAQCDSYVYIYDSSREPLHITGPLRKSCNTPVAFRSLKNITAKLDVAIVEFIVVTVGLENNIERRKEFLVGEQ